MKFTRKQDIIFDFSGTIVIAVCKSDKDGYVRLTNGTATTGRVEVYCDFEWGTVCAHQWDKDHAGAGARVVCRQLGYRGGNMFKVDHTASIPIWIEHVKCNGNEERLVDCTHKDNKNDHCRDENDNDKAVAVACIPGWYIPIEMNHKGVWYWYSS